MAGAIALAAVFLVVVVEMVFATLGAATHAHGGFEAIESEPPSSPTLRRSIEEVPFLAANGTDNTMEGNFKKHRRSRSGSISTALNQIDKDDRLDNLR